MLNRDWKIIIITGSCGGSRISYSGDINRKEDTQFYYLLKATGWARLIRSYSSPRIFLRNKWKCESTMNSIWKNLHVSALVRAFHWLPRLKLFGICFKTVRDMLNYWHKVDFIGPRVIHILIFRRELLHELSTKWWVE